MTGQDILRYAYPINTGGVFIHTDKNVDSVFKAASIVLLGEEQHGDGKTFVEKSKIVNFLNKNYGYDVILFESGFFELNTLQLNNRINEKELKKNIYSVWGRASQFDSILSVIFENKLAVGGFDSRHKGAFAKDSLKEYIDSLVKANKCFDTGNINYTKFTNTIEKLVKYEFLSDTDDTERNNFFYVLDEIIFNYKRVSSVNYNHRVLINLRNFAKQTWLQNKSEERYFAEREKNMAQNIIWLKDSLYKNKKIIVWCANLHAAFKTDDNYKPMGAYLKEYFGELVLSVLTSSYSGERAEEFDKTYRIKPPSDNSVENYLHKQNYSSALFFVDFLKVEPQKIPQMFRLPRKVNPKEVADVMLFIDVMQPAIYRKR